MKKKIIVLAIVTALIVALTFLPHFIPLTGIPSFCFKVFIYLTIGAVAIVGMILTGIPSNLVANSSRRCISLRSTGK